LRARYAEQNNYEKVREMEAAAKENYDLAIKFFNEYILIDPIFPLTYYQLAALYSQTGDPYTAEKILKGHLEYPENLKKHPHDFWVENWTRRRFFDYAGTYSQLGGLYLSNDKLDEARDAYIKSLELNPDDINVLKNITIVYAKQGNKEKEKQVWLEVIKKYPQDADAIRFLEPLGLIKREQ
jgi:tetratricopeptide (TPR) repeat protein